VLEEAKKSVKLEDRSNARVRQSMVLEEAIGQAGDKLIDNVVTDILLEDILMGMIKDNVVS
jgi:hypothetical protein